MKNTNKNSDILKFFNKNDLFSINELVSTSVNSSKIPTIANLDFIGEYHILNVNKNTKIDAYNHIGNNNLKSSILVLSNEGGYSTIFKNTTKKDQEETVSYHLIQGVIPNIEKLSQTAIQEEFSNRISESMVLRNMPSQNQERIVVNSENGKSHSYQGKIASALDKNGLTPTVINVNNHKKQSDLKR
jgi:hypothetical protein